MHTFESNNVPDKYWKEPLKWLLKHDLKEWGTLEDKLAKIEDTVRGITQRYMEERDTD